jgi:hypothetical protein
MIRDTRHLVFVRAITEALRARSLPRPTDDQIKRAWRSGLSAADAASVLAMGR